MLVQLWQMIAICIVLCRVYICMRVMTLICEITIAGATIAPWVNLQYTSGEGVDPAVATFLALSLLSTIAAFVLSFVRLGRMLNWLRCGSGHHAVAPWVPSAASLTNVWPGCGGESMATAPFDGKFRSLSDYLASLPSLMRQRTIQAMHSLPFALAPAGSDAPATTSVQSCLAPC